MESVVGSAPVEHPHYQNCTYIAVHHLQNLIPTRLANTTIADYKLGKKLLKYAMADDIPQTVPNLVALQILF